MPLPYLLGDDHMPFTGSYKPDDEALVRAKLALRPGHYFRITDLVKLDPVSHAELLEDLKFVVRGKAIQRHPEHEDCFTCVTDRAGEILGHYRELFVGPMPTNTAQPVAV